MAKYLHIAPDVAVQKAEVKAIVLREFGRRPIVKAQYVPTKEGPRFIVVTMDGTNLPSEDNPTKSMPQAKSQVFLAILAKRIEELRDSGVALPRIGALNEIATALTIAKEKGILTRGVWGGMVERDRNRYLEIVRKWFGGRIPADVESKVSEVLGAIGAGAGVAGRLGQSTFL